MNTRYTPEQKPVICAALRTRAEVLAARAAELSGAVRCRCDVEAYAAIEESKRLINLSFAMFARIDAINA